MRIFVIGGTGFLGSALVSLLIKEGHNVTVLTSGTNYHSNQGKTFTEKIRFNNLAWQTTLSNHYNEL